MKNLSNNAAMMPEMSFEEILTSVNETIAKLSEDVNAANRMLGGYGFCEHISVRNYVMARVREKFPFAVLLNDLGQKTNEEIANGLLRWKYFSYIPLANTTERIDTKKRTVKFRYKLPWQLTEFLNIIGLGNDKYEVETLNDGSQKYIFKDEEAFSRVVAIINWRNEETENALKALDDNELEMAFEKTINSIKLVVACKSRVQGDYKKIISLEDLPQKMFKNFPLQVLQSTEVYFTKGINTFLVKEHAKRFVRRKLKEIADIG